MSTPRDENLAGRLNRDDDLKVPRREGQPPRPATEPAGAESSSRTSKTATDPATGAPTPGAKR
jgi:hypothetical protein